MERGPFNASMKAVSALQECAQELAKCLADGGERKGTPAHFRICEIISARVSRCALTTSTRSIRTPHQFGNQGIFKSCFLSKLDALLIGCVDCV